MPNPSTPPHSQDAHSGRILSKTTPLKRDLSGSQSHTSTPELRASTRYKEMTIDAGERFVGPMPIAQFLSDFVPKASKKRPKNNFVFDHSSVSQNEDEFASPSTFKHDCVLTLIPDPSNQSIWPLSPTPICQHNFSARRSIPFETRYLHLFRYSL
jgi:hypothetical protein